MIALVCPECQRDNEAERVYCHDCGVRLDRSAVISRVSPEEKLKQTQKHVRSMFSQRGIKARFYAVWICKLVLGAFLVAALAQMLIPPDVPPPPKGPGEISQIGLELERSANGRGPAQLQYSQDQVNAHFSYTLKTKRSQLDKPLLEFKRALAEFEESRCTITVERSIFGFSLYTASSYAVRPDNGKLKVSNQGGRIGRLPVHPAIMQFLDIIFADVWSALDRDRRSIAKMDAVEFRDKMVVLTAPAQVR